MACPRTRLTRTTNEYLYRLMCHDTLEYEYVGLGLWIHQYILMYGFYFMVRVSLWLSSAALGKNAVWRSFFMLCNSTTLKGLAALRSFQVLVNVRFLALLSCQAREAQLRTASHSRHRWLWLWSSS